MSIKSEWEYGIAPDFWMDENFSSECHFYVLDHDSEVRFPIEKVHLLDVLTALDVIRYGCVYEGIWQICIKPRH